MILHLIIFYLIQKIQILIKLNSGESFSLDDLAIEFNVSKRTIQRDINEKFSYLPLIRENGYVRLEEYALGKLNYNDLKNFAILSGIKHLYPSLDDDFVVDLLNTKLNSTYLIKGYDYEDMSSKKEDFNLINIAIVKLYQITFVYNNKQRVINPYKLVNTSGTWYLVGDEDGILKTYTFSKISNLNTTIDTFSLNEEFVQTINQNQATWFSQTKIDVTLEIDNKVIEYFTKKQILPKQKLIEENKEYCIITAQVSYDEEILRIIRYWIPHIKIIEPTYLRDKLKEQLDNYNF